ncbi:hypothetical protein GGU10DRAFT_95989 [Lentinula aff. detonsa]|uniref:Smr domain-containing protein n=1 Tax=Lentinula aff. detonsa TaxID=2804958 RepID=A0AA38NNW6_9AGAR|nr:hypothetical protein GGU10DRAFT_95989 [Lentinula aff. detonsa]
MSAMFWGAPPKASYGLHSLNRILLLFYKSPSRKQSMLNFLSRNLLIKSLGGLCTLGTIFFIAKVIRSLLHKASRGSEPSEQLSPQPLDHIPLPQPNRLSPDPHSYPTEHDLYYLQTPQTQSYERDARNLQARRNQKRPQQLEQLAESNDLNSTNNNVSTLPSPPPSVCNSQRIDNPQERPLPDLNQVNKNNPDYLHLRRQATENKDAMARCTRKCKRASDRCEYALAEKFSEQGKKYQLRMEKLNKQASDWIYNENNKVRKPGEIDLHGLFVEEAIERVVSAIEDSRCRGDTEILLIVGKGLHSSGGVPKLKDAIEEFIKPQPFLVARSDPTNGGRLIVRLE